MDKLVPYYEQTLITAVVYQCRYPRCSNLEDYRALGNEPKYGHLCKTHWEGLTQSEFKSRYIKVVVKG